ncbi:MAG: GWxTD domain-containing protein, partial [Cyclonatronaceae bacterium]
MKFYLLILSLIFVSASSLTEPEEELLKQGLELEAQGRYEQALDLWTEAFTELETPSLAIGREFVRVAAGNGLESYYPLANNIYFWGLSAQTVEVNSQALEEELLFLEPLVERSVYKKWNALYLENDPEIYRQIHLFWRRIDPSPGTSYNARLIEHWERITYARENFTINTHSVYQTDERGVSWVKYGKPDRQYSGTLQVSGGQVESVIANLDPLLPELKRETLARTTLDIHEYPRYEIWIYEKPNAQMEFNLIQIFGDRPSGGYSRIQTIDDFISSRAFTSSGRHEGLVSGRRSEIAGGSRLTPGMIFQWLYYEQLAAKDFYFSNIFSEMLRDWQGDPRSGANQRFGKHSGQVLRQNTEAAALLNLNRAPSEMSTYEKEFPEIPLQAYHYRMLDEQGRPVAATFVESRPLQAFLEDLSLNNSAIFPTDDVSAEEGFAHYELSHGLQYFGSDGEMLSQIRMPTGL